MNAAIKTGTGAARKFWDKYGKKKLIMKQKQEWMLQKLLPKEQFKRMQKLQEI